MNFNFLSSDEEKHSAAHVLAAAVKRLYPSVRIGVGPVTKNGFYYDFDLDQALTKEDLKHIESTANEIIAENLPFNQLHLDRDTAQNMLLQVGQIYKAELIQSIPDENVSFFKTGEEFIDLCRGPHVSSTGKLGLIAINEVSETNWKEDPNRPKMVRISGMHFKNLSEFKEYQEAKSQVKQRNFLKIGISKNLILANEDISSPIVNFTTRGTAFRRRIEDLILKTYKDLELENIEAESVNNSTKAGDLFNNEFSNSVKSYRNIPVSYSMRFKEHETINENNYVGENIYIKSFLTDSETLDFLTYFIDGIKEILDVISDYTSADLYCSNLEDTFVTSISNYLQKNLISHNKVIRNLDAELVLELIFKSSDSINKVWKFIDLKVKREPKTFYMNSVNTKVHPISIELCFNILNIIAFLLEEKGLSLPAKIHPITAKIIPISKNYLDYAKKVKEIISSKNISCETDSTSRSFKAKIRAAENTKIPFILVVGNKEQANKAVSLRKKGHELGLVSIDDVQEMIQKEIT